MHTISTQSQQLRLNLNLGICNQQSDNDIAMETNQEMSGKNCKNIQHRRGKRRRHGHRATGTGALGGGGGTGFASIFWSINLTILICLADSTNAVPTDSSSSSSSSISNSNIASSTVVMAAVTPSSIASGGTGSSTISSVSTTESSLEQQQPQGQCLLDGLWVSETTVRCEKQTSCRAIKRTGHCCSDYKCDCEKDGKTYANGYKLVDPNNPCTVCYCKGGEIVCSSVTCFRRDDCMPKYVTGRCCPEYDNCPILDNNPSLAGETNSMASTTTKPVPVAPAAGFNWNITIKEITKPTEIRITDDNHKVKQTIPTRKVVSTEAPATTAAAAAAAASSTTAAAIVAESTAATATATAATTATEATTAAASVTTATSDTPATPTSSSAPSQDTNQKALPVNSSESLKLIASVGYNSFGPQQKPLVTYNADGLQPLAENDPSKVNIKREYTTEGVAAVGEQMPLGLSSHFIQNGFRDALVDNGAAIAELEPDTAGSDNIYHIISTTEGPSGSSSSSSTERQQLSTDGSTSSGELSSSYGYENSTTELPLSTEGLSAVSSSSESPVASSTHNMHHMEEDEVPQVESNPAYPSLPEDDFSLRDVNFPLVELEEIVEAESKDEQRSIISAFERDHKRTKQVIETIVDAAGSGNGSGSGDMELQQALPSDSVPIMYSAEDSSAETRIQNASELARIRLNPTENESSAELESGSGSGNGDLREPTTPRVERYMQVLDIDELGSGAEQAQSRSEGLEQAQDPKADAESLKLNEEPEDAKTNPSIVTHIEKSFVEHSEAGAAVAAVAAGQRLDRLYLKRIY